MPGLKLDLKRRPEGGWEEVTLRFEDKEARIRVLATSPYVLRFLIMAPKEVKIETPSRTRS